MKQISSIGIIGFGKFGKLLVEKLDKGFDVRIFCRHPKEMTDYILKNRLMTTCVSLKHTIDVDLLILSVPISSFKRVLKEIKPYLKPKTTLMDVLSVKEYPANLMKKLNPKNIELLATHPLFGPRTINDKKVEKKIIICPIRIKSFSNYKKFFKALGFTPIITTPRKHDQKMAQTQLLVHYIGRGLKSLNLKPEQLSTPKYNLLLELQAHTSSDTDQLFKDMNKYNKYAKKTRKQLIDSLSKIDANLS